MDTKFNSKFESSTNLILLIACNTNNLFNKIIIIYVKYVLYMLEDPRQFCIKRRAIFFFIKPMNIVSTHCITLSMYPCF